MTDPRTMKAVAVHPGVAQSLHLREVAVPELGSIPDGRGVLVKVVRIGGCGTDLEIEAGEYGEAPQGDDFLIIGHENLGQVVDVGPQVPATLTRGSYVVATVRRPGHSIYDMIGMQDMTTDDVYFERGINLRRGYMAEYYVESAGYLVPLPQALRDVGVLVEPTSVVEKGVHQAYEIQRRLRVWQPRRAAVLGAGPVGLLGCLVLRSRGLEVTCLSQEPSASPRGSLVTEIGCRYVSTQEKSVAAASGELGPFDVIVEASGYSPLAFQAAEMLGKNGVLVLVSVTGGDRKVEVDADHINQGFVLGNKVMVGSVNASYADFTRAVDDMIAAEARYPGWLSKLLTTHVDGLENFATFMQRLKAHDGIKVYMELGS